MSKVFVGLSGGVDSAVSAALLKENGYDVTGVFIKIWQPEFIECTWREDRLDAMRAAASLHIPFREVDLSDQYKREVVDGMIADYALGITPNPDIHCNRAIKFGSFLRWALGEGADAIATGHYARLIDRRGRYALYRGKDLLKDQSYFLYRLSQGQLVHTLFPVGDLTKSEVRALARKFALPNAEKPDSQGICFLGDVTMEEFLSRFISLKRGAVLDAAGVAIGEHSGAAIYTIGQRHGFTVHEPRESGREHYVIGIDVIANTITVSHDKRDAVRAETTLEQMHWINPQELPLEAGAQARYRETPVSVRLEKLGEGIEGCLARFREPRLASPGQSLVVYEGDCCLGGGIIC